MAPAGCDDSLRGPVSLPVRRLATPPPLLLYSTHAGLFARRLFAVVELGLASVAGPVPAVELGLASVADLVPAVELGLAFVVGPASVADSDLVSAVVDLVFVVVFGFSVG